MSNIPFAIGRNGELNTLSGSTEWLSLPAIFAAYHTARPHPKGHIPTYLTDRDGLVKLAQTCDYAAERINDTVGLIGKLLAYVDHPELSPNEYRGLGWLLSGLSELQESVLNAADDMRRSLENGAFLESSGREVVENE